MDCPKFKESHLDQDYVFQGKSAINLKRLSLNLHSTEKFLDNKNKGF